MFSQELTEEELFSQIDSYAPIQGKLMDLLQSISLLRKAILADRPDLQGQVCPLFQRTICQLEAFKNALGACSIGQYPAGLFTELSPAFHWVMKRLRRILPKVPAENDPLAETTCAFDRFKELCRPDTRPDEMDDSAAVRQMTHFIRDISEAGRRIGCLIVSASEESEIGRREEGPEARLADAATAMVATVADIHNATERLDRRDRRHRDAAGTGTKPSSKACQECGRLWREWRSRPEWIEGAKAETRVSKAAVYETVKARGLLPPSIDCFKTFVRAIDTARKSKATA